MVRRALIALGLAAMVLPTGAATASGSLRPTLLTRQQEPALLGRSVTVSVTGAPGAVRIGLGALVGNGRRALPIARGRTLRLTARRRAVLVTMPLTARGLRALGDCRRVLLRVLLSRGGRTSSSTRPLAHDAARCVRPAPKGELNLLSAGAATRSIAPTSPRLATHVGGFGDCKKCPTTGVERGDDLTARALVVRRGTHTVVTLTADLEGWFAGYKQGAHLGIKDFRDEIAAELRSRRHLDVGPEDIVVQTTHCHACPTVVGIWGKTNVDYLRFVYARAKEAVLAAAARARPATLRYATADLGYINDVLVGQANANEGWPLDTQANLLQASDARTGATIATWATVPAHANIVFGPQSHLMSSDYFGAVDRWLEASLGGTAIVGPATLGDQTTPMQGDNSRRHVLGLLPRLGALVGSTVSDALAEHGHAIPGDSAVSGAQTYLVVPATNPLLAGANCNDQVSSGVGIEIDRSCALPYAVPPAAFGTWFTTLRLGPLAIASEPGEAFPHVTFAMRRALRPGAKAVFVMGQAQDQLGYYYEPWAFPTTFVYSADHNIFHASLALAEDNVQTQILNARKLGFATTPTAADPRGIDFTRLVKPGVQAWAYPSPLGADTRGQVSVTVAVYRGRARSGDAGLAGPAPDPAVDFGDGSPEVTRGSPKGASTCCIEIRHTYPHPGSYRITARLPGTAEKWTSVARLDSAYEVINQPRYPVGF